MEQGVLDLQEEPNISVGQHLNGSGVVSSNKSFSHGKKASLSSNLSPQRW